MTLRSKVWLGTAGIVLAVAAVGCVIQAFYATTVARQLNRERAEGYRHFLVTELASEVSLVDGICAGLAADLRGESSTADRVWAEKAAGFGALGSRVGLFAYLVDLRGQVLWREDGVGASEETVVDSSLLRAFAAERRARQGVLETQRGLAALAYRPLARPIAGPESATGCVVGKVLGAGYFEKRLDASRGGFRVWLASDPAVPGEHRALLTSGLAGPYAKEGNVITLGRALWVYEDLRGQPALVFAGHEAPDVSQATRRVVVGTLGLQLMVGAAAAAAYGAFFHRRVTNVLSALAAHCSRIQQAEAQAPEFVVRSGDEVGLLAGEVNRLVQRLQSGLRRVTDEHRELSRAHQSVTLAVEGAQEAVWDYDPKLNRMTFSPAWWAMLGYEATRGPQPLADWAEMIHPDDRSAMREKLERCLSSPAQSFEAEYRVQRKDGEYAWVLVRSRVVRDNSGAARRVLGLHTDITGIKEKEDQLARSAFYDALTGLANRHLFLDHLSMACKRAARDKTYSFAILFFDLDRFKVINDGLGHLKGDKLLQASAERIRDSVRAVDTIGRGDRTIARLGGDEFIVLLDNVYDVRDAIRVAERIQGILGEPFQIDGNEIFISASIGITVARGVSTAEDILRNADTALYRAKAGGGASYAVFDMQMGEEAKKRLRLETDLRRAIERQEFQLVYQPIVALKTGKISGFEALIRWTHPDLGPVPPNDFIHIAEETGAIVPIGEWVLAKACRQTCQWQKMFPQTADLCVNVNFSVRELHRPQLVDMLSATLAAAGLEAKYLNIEVVERALLESSPGLQATLAKLCEMQVSLCVDDFGTGYSSLGYLHRFPMSGVKIDLSFVRNMHVSAESYHLVRTIIAMARNLNLVVTSEGVESLHQLHELRELGSDYAQGYLLHRPVSAEEAAQILAADPTW